MQVQWFNPCEGWYKLNTDGTSLGNPRKASGGGLIRNHKGIWMKGFNRCIRNTTSVMAEYSALRDDMQLTSQMGISRLEVELDAKLVVNLVI